MILFDTTEMRKPTTRKLHAAIAELERRQALVSPTAARELAANGHEPRGVNGVSTAEHMLQAEHGRLTPRKKNRLEQDAWWAQMWRDPNSPYGLVELSDHDANLAEEIERSIPHECFATRGRTIHDLTGHSDTKIVAEALAVGATLLLASNVRTIRHREVNKWAVEEGRRIGFQPKE